MKPESEVLALSIRHFQRLHSLLADAVAWQSHDSTQGGRLWTASQVPRDVISVSDTLFQEVLDVLGNRGAELTQMLTDIRELVVLLLRSVQKLTDDELGSVISTLYVTSVTIWASYVQALNLDPRQFQRGQAENC